MNCQTREPGIFSHFHWIQDEPDDDTMARVKVLYCRSASQHSRRDFVLLSILWIQSKFKTHPDKLKLLSIRNLTATVTEENLRETFERLHCITYFTYLNGFWDRWNCSIRRFGRVERVKKIKDYAFVHFEERIQAVEGEKEHDMKVNSTLWVCGRWKWIWCESIFNPLGLSSSGIVKDLALPLLFLSNHAQDHLWWVSESSHIQLCCEFHWRAPRSPTYILNIQNTFSTDKHFLNQHTT